MPDIAELEQRMRPGVRSVCGFLDETESLSEVLATDARTVRDLGLTCDELAEALSLLIEAPDVVRPEDYEKFVPAHIRRPRAARLADEARRVAEIESILDSEERAALLEEAEARGQLRKVELREIADLLGLDAPEMDAERRKLADALGFDPSEPHFDEVLREEVDRQAPLSAAQEVELAKRIERGDTEAKLRMIRSNLRLVVSVTRNYRGVGLPFPLGIQAGTPGLIRAVETFDWRRGYEFSAYATWWIREAIAWAASGDGRAARRRAIVERRFGRVELTLWDVGVRYGGRYGIELSVWGARVGGRYEVELTKYAGIQDCPWDGERCEVASTDWRIRDTVRNVELSGPTLITHLIRAHRFFEGFGSPYRVDPRELAVLLDLGPFSSESAPS